MVATVGAAMNADRARKLAIIGVSVGAHVLVLGYMAFSAIEGPRRYGVPSVIQDPWFDRPVEVRLEPRPTVRGETARARSTRPDDAMQPIPDTGRRLTQTTGATGSARVGDTPSPPAPRFSTSSGAAAAPTAGVESSRWQVRPEGLGARIARSGRTGTVGCASPDLLSARERAICDERFGERAAAAPPIGGSGDTARAERFAREGRRALATYEARRRPLAGGVGVVGPQDGPGSNFGTGVAGAHLDPALRPDSTANVRTRRDRTREIEED